MVLPEQYIAERPELSCPLKSQSDSLDATGDESAPYPYRDMCFSDSACRFARVIYLHKKNIKRDTLLKERFSDAAGAQKISNVRSKLDQPSL